MNRRAVVAVIGLGLALAATVVFARQARAGRGPGHGHGRRAGHPGSIRRGRGGTLNNITDDRKPGGGGQEPRAFEATIRVGEGTSGPNGYRTLFGGGLFDSFDDHPRQARHREPGREADHVDAAGAYQILSRTWDDFTAANGPHDFSPASQGTNARPGSSSAAARSPT